jgi:hypothetical protein
MKRADCPRPPTSKANESFAMQQLMVANSRSGSNPEDPLSGRTSAAAKCRLHALRRADNEAQPLPIGKADCSSAIRIAPAAPPSAHTGNRCSVIRELPAGRAEVLLLLAAFMPSAGEHCETNLSLFCGCQSAFAIRVPRAASRAH